ncbi:hypothetical protein HYQ45_018876 [Verticillium longisporum]|uniref:5'-3' exoribonuclease 2 n=1 Tax=Verticillium longisporum TaxID=100787 RepID=A0A8I2ZSE4_VERLO|nr:hypothetical protein HYQ45_018876 [Verticillium longisporum]
MVRPRKLLMIAVDGVAPRAKMNQQRSRRFRSAQEAQEKEVDKQELLKLLKQQNGGILPPETLESMNKKAFDSNSITPGTPFMDTLATSLRYWCAYKLNTDPAWARLKIIISDATVPGEGEHKIMNYVRSQRGSPDYDPNTRHVIYGLDADLIMLGLATHEPHFRVLREDVFAQDAKAKMCKICGQKGHDARVCKGEAKDKDGEYDEQDKAVDLKPFIWLHVSIFREYLAIELDVPDLPFRFDLERAIDDWVFMCCFVGNDFLPHLPALEIRENGIDALTTIWKENLPRMGGYVTKDGHIDLKRVQLIMDGLAKQEDAIFRRRKEQEDRREANAKRRKLQDERSGRGGRTDASGRGRGKPPLDNASSGLALFPVSGFPNADPSAVTHDMVVGRSSNANINANAANKSAANVIRERIQASGTQGKSTNGDATIHPNVEAPAVPEEGAAAASSVVKRKADVLDEPSQLTPNTGPSAAEEAAIDHVRMWEEGYADRYYEQKFHVDRNDVAFRHKVAQAYVEGLCWVLLYYYQGCPSWDWYYPYHYAPFAADFADLDKIEISFEKGRISKPFEQLMSVMPAASRRALPEVFHDLMLNEDSEVIDFYPQEFEIDLNGKKFAWQGVALLPFIDMPRLLAAVEKKYPLLSPEDAARNGIGRDVLLLSDAHHELYEDITSHFYSKKQGAPTFGLNPRTSDGMTGQVEKIADYLPHGSLEYPLDRKSMPSLDYDRSLSATNIAAILDSLITLLEELGRGYKSFSSHPSHVVSSEVYVLALASDCCAAHWEAVRSNSLRQLVKQTNTRRGSLQVVPTPLDDSLVSRLLNVLRNLLDPTPDGFILPAHTILGHGPRHAERAAWLDTGADILSQDDVLATDKYDLTISPVSMESHAKTLVEYLTASSWTSVFDHLRKVVYTIRTTGVAQQQPSQTPPMGEDDRANLVALRLISFYWVDSQKLGQVIQEICSSYLHLRRPFQTAIAAVLPLLVVSWLERHPHEFVQLHTLHKRLDGGADTLFDMTQAIVDNGRKKGMMFAMQITLLLLLPDVFEVASNLREAKSSSMAKKTAFLDGLRKSLRNKNEAAAYCLVLLLRAARHFDAEDDTAIVSFALDVQDEVKDAVFRRSAPNADGSHFEQDLLSAAFDIAGLLSDNSTLDITVQALDHPKALMALYAKWKGQAYLKATLQKVVERLVLTSKDLGLELDPARVTSNDELQKNALQLRIVAKVFIDDICASSSSVPSSFRQICSIDGLSIICIILRHMDSESIDYETLIFCYLKLIII